MQRYTCIPQLSLRRPKAAVSDPVTSLGHVGSHIGCPLYGYTAFYLCIYPLVDFWIVSTF